MKNFLAYRLCDLFLFLQKVLFSTSPKSYTSPKSRFMRSAVRLAQTRSRTGKELFSELVNKYTIL